MTELLVDFITSLDGYASGEGWPGFWGLQGPEYLAREEENTTFEMTANRTFDGQIQLVEYRPSVLEHPPLSPTA